VEAALASLQTKKSEGKGHLGSSRSFCSLRPSNGKITDIRGQRHTCVSVIHTEPVIKLCAWISSCRSRWVCAPVGCTCCSSRFVVVAVKAFMDTARLDCSVSSMCMLSSRAGTAGANPLSARRESRPRHAHVITPRRSAACVIAHRLYSTL
jgi:hypothetical protein